MARGRLLVKSFSTSKKRGALIAQHGTPCPHCGGSLAEFAQVLYMLILAHADDFGRQEGDVFTVQKLVDPLSPRSEADFNRALQALDAVGLVRWFSGAKGHVVAIHSFEEHQGNLHKRTTTKFPDPPGSSGDQPEVPGYARARNGMEWNGIESNKRKKERAAAPRRAHPPKTERPNVKTLAAMVLREILPLKLRDDDLPEAVKERAAKHHLPYDGRSVTSAINSALTQARKRTSTTKGA